jgi:4-alpha-glucanotransferase
MQPGVLFSKRRAGILLHPTSLPATIGNGDLGNQAKYFIDFLVSCGVSVWQMLPLGPPHADLSPYQAQSVHAINPRLINLEQLINKGWLKHDVDLSDRFSALTKAYNGFLHHAQPQQHQALQEFREQYADWLPDYALYRLLKTKYENASWTQWPSKYRDRKPDAIAKLQQEHAHELEFYVFEQFIAFAQWLEIKTYAAQKGIFLFGDMPIFVAHDSVDVWANRANFLLDKKGQPKTVAGVPPDYFSATGQLWGNPHYDWDYMQQDGFKWWLRRFEIQAVLFDVIRIDHFRGFEACWSVPAGETTAINGQWVKVPGRALFDFLTKHINLPLVAEDLGVITDEVVALRQDFDLPGMKILQFAFDSGADNAYLPHNHEPNSVVYTGTHDNDTTCGWFNSLPEHVKQKLYAYLHCQAADMPWALIESAYASVARLAIIPMQDILALDSEHRMNTPGTVDGNWRWRFEWSWLNEGTHACVRHLGQFYDRS